MTSDPTEGRGTRGGFNTGEVERAQETDKNPRGKTYTGLHVQRRRERVERRTSRRHKVHDIYSLDVDIAAVFSPCGTFASLLDELLPEAHSEILRTPIPGVVTSVVHREVVVSTADRSQGNRNRNQHQGGVVESSIPTHIPERNKRFQEA